MTQANSLETFDVLELLSVLASGEKTGALHILRGGETFSIWLLRGRVVQVEGARASGPPALAELLHDQTGRFQFEAGEAAPRPQLDLSVRALSYQVLTLLPPLRAPFAGAGKVARPEELSELHLSDAEQALLERVEVGEQVGELLREPLAAELLPRLARLKLLKPRRARLARLTVQLSRAANKVALIDESIYLRWREALARPLRHIEVREDGGQVHLFAVKSQAGLGAALLLPPELLIRSGLKAGHSVLARPEQLQEDR